MSDNYKSEMSTCCYKCSSDALIPAFDIGNDIAYLDVVQMGHDIDTFSYIPELVCESSAPPTTERTDGHLMSASEALPDLDIIINSARPAVPKSRRCIRLNKTAVQLMKHWYTANRDHPYPENNIAEELAKAGNITVEQVKKWFSNKRMRGETSSKPSHHTQHKIVCDADVMYKSHFTL